MNIPGSKSITNRALVLAALADAPSTLRGALISRDTQLMMDALRSLGADITPGQDHLGEVTEETTIAVAPMSAITGGAVDCGLAGTVMRFVPPIAALSTGDVVFTGDKAAQRRPMGTMLDALRQLGVDVESAEDKLPFSVKGRHTDGRGRVQGGVVRMDASSSSQFVSGLLLAGALYEEGITVIHTGNALPSLPHVEMTVDMLRQTGVSVDTEFNQWTVHPGTIRPKDWKIEPDLSNATPFLAAAAVAGGRVRVQNWPQSTTQPGDQFRQILQDMGAEVEFHADSGDLVATHQGPLNGITWDMHDIGELAPTVVAVAALATSRSHLYGIAHLRGHETDRLAALARNLNSLGGNVTETEDGLIIDPAPLHGGRWESYDDHRMATAGAIIGLQVPGMDVENIETTSKTLPGFADRWNDLVKG